jgi:hypothetical protein
MPMCDSAHPARAGAVRLRNVITQSADATAIYRGLHTYLNGRYADTVVLTFSEIEDLLGFALPEAARVRVEWWTDDTADGGDTPQSHAWTHASRTAKPNLFARTVVFERTRQ